MKPIWLACSLLVNALLGLFEYCTFVRLNEWLSHSVVGHFKRPWRQLSTGRQLSFIIRHVTSRPAGRRRFRPDMNFGSLGAICDDHMASVTWYTREHEGQPSCHAGAAPVLAGSTAVRRSGACSRLADCRCAGGRPSAAPRAPRARRRAPSGRAGCRPPRRRRARAGASPRRAARRARPSPAPSAPGAWRRGPRRSRT